MRMKKLLVCGFSVFLICAAFHVQSQEKPPVKACIAVMDFVNPDIAGQRKFLNFESKQIRIGNDCTLKDQDRVSMNSVMQGYVRMIDSQDKMRTNEANRTIQLRDNEFDRTKTLQLYETVTHGPIRPLLIGADYLTACLGKHPDVFSNMDSAVILQAMKRLSAEPDFPKDFMLRLSQETGATHLVYGTIADIHSKLKQYKGYGIETKTLLYELDVIIKVVDLPAQKIIYSKIYTGILKEQNMGTGGLVIDNNKYQTLMKSAMEQTGEDLYERFRPGRADSFKITPIPPGKKMKRAESAPKTAVPGSAKITTVPAARSNEIVIIHQNTSSVYGPNGLPSAPKPPVPVPVAADGKASVVIVPSNTAGLVVPVKVNK